MMSTATSLPSSQRYRILIVDDEVKIVELLSNFLKLKYDVDTCTTVSESMKRLGSESYDVLITDLRLPDGNGIDLLRCLKERDPFAEVIIITGYASVDTATAAVNLGVCSYLTKPISLTVLGAQVDRALANREFHIRSRVLL